MTSWDCWKTAQPDLEIHGTEGSLSLPHPNWHGGPLKYARPRGEWEIVPLDDEPMARPNWPPENPQQSNYRGIGVAEMIDAMERGAEHRTPADLAAHVVEAADAIVTSARTAATVLLKLSPPRPAPIGRTDVARLLNAAATGRAAGPG
jgi:predicted dehydrogenase